MENETLLISTKRADSQFEKNGNSYPQKYYSQRKPKEILLRIWPWIAHFIFLIISISILLKSMMIRNSLPANCLESSRQWKTIMGSIPEEYHFERVNGSFDRSSSPYKGPPTPAVEAAWKNLTEYGSFKIPEEIFQQLNLSKASVKVPESFGGGRLVFMEGFHQIHCLANLWRHTYPDYYTEIADKIKRNYQPWHEHMDHCADMLRQKLMCDADIQLFTYNWIKGHNAPHPNFNIGRQCRNYDVLKQYAIINTIDASNLPNAYFMKPKDGSVMEFDKPPFDIFEEGSPSQP